MTATFRFHGDLAELVPGARHAVVRRRVAPHCTVKDQFEACGVPHTEVAAVTLDGATASFRTNVAAGSTVDVYPDALTPPGVSRCRPPWPRPARFVADVHLGKLMRILRLLGLDVDYRNDADDEALARASALESRILLTRDRGLLKRAVVVHGALVRSTDPLAQAVETVRRFDLCGQLAPFTRCLACGGLLRPVPKEAVADRLPPMTRRRVEHFEECRRCTHIYWAGAHHGHLVDVVARVRRGACASR